MNSNILLSWLKSDSAINRIRAARELKKTPEPELLDEINAAFLAEELPWVKNALNEVIEAYSSENTKTLQIPARQKVSSEISPLIDDIEAIQSKAINESIGQLLHELEPQVGSLKIVARSELSDYPNSNLKKEFDRLDDLLATFEDWRKVEQAPRFTKVNVYRLVSEQVDREKCENTKVTIHIDRNLECYSDRSLLRIIFSNAIRNANESILKTARKDGEIIITAGVSEKGLWSSVVDNGAGLPANLELIYKSRQSTKPGHKGMGLAVVHKAVSALNGTWELTKGATRGAVFFFEISRVE